MVSLRETKGREIAARATSERDGVYWRVPSQAGDGVYMVDVTSTPPTCTCQDYELRGLKCKHLYAIQYHLTAQAAANRARSRARNASGTRPSPSSSTHTAGKR